MPNSVIEIRRATADEWQTYRDIRLRALTGAPDAYVSTLVDAMAFDEADWRRRVGGACALFGMLDGRVVAIATGIPDRHETGGREVVGMWVDPDARGLGVAASLIEALASWAVEDGATSIALWVADGNDAARRVYERCGFAETGERGEIRPGLGEARMRRALP